MAILNINIKIRKSVERLGRWMGGCVSGWKCVVGLVDGWVGGQGHVTEHLGRWVGRRSVNQCSNISSVH